MATFVPENGHLRGSLLFCFLLKKSAAESHRMLVEAYGDHALSERTCEESFRRFKNGKLNVENEERGKPPKKWDLKDVVYDELLKPGKTVNFARYRQQMVDLNHALLEKRPEWKT